VGEIYGDHMLKIIGNVAIVIGLIMSAVYGYYENIWENNRPRHPEYSHGFIVFYKGLHGIYYISNHDVMIKNVLVYGMMVSFVTFFVIKVFFRK